MLALRPYIMTVSLTRRPGPSNRPLPLAEASSTSETPLCYRRQRGKHRSVAPRLPLRIAAVSVPDRQCRDGIYSFDRSLKGHGQVRVATVGSVFLPRRVRDTCTHPGVKWPAATVFSLPFDGAVGPEKQLCFPWPCPDPQYDDAFVDVGFRIEASCAPFSAPSPIAVLL